MANDKIIHCEKISVDCVENDPVDVKCGGPDYLGFDFSVPKKQTKEMIKFIVEALNTLEVPLVSIYSSGERDVEESKVWTKEKIVREIKKDANYLKSEASRNTIGRAR